ncbi:hypothetical protein [Fusibacillus kribbianus]|uniref:Uncharacterized protein n=1 Tax=Fusibacillus kribbianus TaxID=3044208 RepID=A0AAP4BD95_9FIRM|nr:hypothetical protein [Ruminococcus sp. YH-rum2234]MDI9242209.1 hypothetical protein [Ruminococcus sp. YH-rum2234]
MREQLKQFMGIQKKDCLLEKVTFSVFSILIGFAFSLYNGVLGIVYRSLWNGSICVYYFLLAMVRVIIVSLYRKEAAGRHERGAAHRRKACFAAHMVLILMNISLVVPAAVMVAGGRSCTYGLIPAIAMAAYTTYRVAMSIIHYRKSRHNANVLAELRTINMIDSLAAVLTLQNTLIAANGGMNDRMQTLSAWTSAGILAVIIIITVQSLLKIRKVGV